MLTTDLMMTGRPCYIKRANTLSAENNTIHNVSRKRLFHIFTQHTLIYCLFSARLELQNDSRISLHKTNNRYISIYKCISQPNTSK